MDDSAKVELWNPASGVTCHAVVTFGWHGRHATLSLEATGVGITVQVEGQDLFDALRLARRRLEPAGWYPLCNGARTDCYPSGMARDMSGGSQVYELAIGEVGRPPLVGLFDPAPREMVGTVSEQQAHHRRWIEARER